MRCGVVQIRIHIPLLHLLPFPFLLLILLHLFLLLPPPRICSCSASWSPLLLEVGVKESLAERDGAPLVLLSSSKIYSKLLPISYFLRLPNVWILGEKSCIFLVFDTFKAEVQTTGKSPVQTVFRWKSVSALIHMIHSPLVE